MDSRPTLQRLRAVCAATASHLFIISITSTTLNDRPSEMKPAHGRTNDIQFWVCTSTVNIELAESQHVQTESKFANAMRAALVGEAAWDRPPSLTTCCRIECQQGPHHPTAIDFTTPPTDRQTDRQTHGRPHLYIAAYWDDTDGYSLLVHRSAPRCHVIGMECIHWRTISRCARYK